MCIGISIYVFISITYHLCIRIYYLSIIYLSSIYYSSVIIYSYIYIYQSSICLICLSSSYHLSLFLFISMIKNRTNNHSEWSNDNSIQTPLSFHELYFANLANKIRVSEFILTWIWFCGLIRMYPFKCVEWNSKGEHCWQEWAAQHSVCLLYQGRDQKSWLSWSFLDFDA